MMPTLDLSRLLPGGFVFAVALASCLALTSPLYAQVGDQIEDPWSIARDYYRQQQYREAVPYAIEAIHREPQRAEYYLGLARIWFQAGEYDLAVYFYDLYLGDVAAFIPSDAPERSRPERARAERDSANEMREDPTVPVEAPPNHGPILEALDQRLADGQVLTSNQGGAWAMYSALLRAGYAHPDLVSIRARLADALLEEAELFVPRHAPRMPALSFSQWETQQRRYVLWRELRSTGDADSDTSVVDAAIQLTEAQLQYLNLNYEEAARRFESATELDPELTAAWFGWLNASYALGTPANRGVDRALTTLASILGDSGAPELELYRAVFEARDGDHGRAAQRVGVLLGMLDDTASEALEGHANPASTPSEAPPDANGSGTSGEATPTPYAPPQPARDDPTPREPEPPTDGF